MQQNIGGGKEEVGGMMARDLLNASDFVFLPYLLTHSLYLENTCHINQSCGNCFEHESSQFRCRSSLAGIRFHLFPSWLPGSTLSTECIFKYYFKVDWRIGSQTVFLIILAKKSGLAETK